MVSKHSMESDTNIKKPDRRVNNRRAKGDRRDGEQKYLYKSVESEGQRSPRRTIIFSRLAKVIFLSHILGLLILTIGALSLDQYVKGLIESRIDNLKSQASLVASIMGDVATGYGADAQLDMGRAKDIIERLDLSDKTRLRLYDTGQNLIADTDALNPKITVSDLDPLGPLDVNTDVATEALNSLGEFIHSLPWRKARRDRNRRDLHGELRLTLLGDVISGERYDESDRHLVMVSMPVVRVQEILGAITMETYDLESIIRQERLSLIPVIAWAVVASLISSIALTLSIVSPLRDLSRAAEIVARTNKKVDEIPNFSYRKDEIGDLSVILGEMTRRLYSRIDDIANFAADVAHEIKNPLTSLRSASDTLKYAKTKDQRKKLINIIQNDVVRMDRLISDISKASKVDAKLAREKAENINVVELLKQLSDLYTQTQKKGGADIKLNVAESLLKSGVYIRGFETHFAQVLRNLIDNALTFSPPQSIVTLTVKLRQVQKAERVVITVEDQGPGIPEDNLETIFERFYTERPKGATFGSHSGLGLAICRQIVKAHKGFIFAENIISGHKIQGARFVVNLPRQK